MLKDKPVIGKRPNSVAKNMGRIFESPIFWVLFVATAFGVPLVRSLTRHQPELPPVLGNVGDFQLTNQDGRPVAFKDYKGSVVVANFIFTSCPDICPMLTSQMAKIQSRLMGVGPAIRLISITVDPQTDTPSVLKEYASKYRADHKIWQFLTGPIDHISEVVIDGFKMALENPDSKSHAGHEGHQMPATSMDLMSITHGENFVIVDQLGNIRAYQQARNSNDINAIVRTVAILANSKPEAVYAR